MLKKLRLKFVLVILVIVVLLLSFVIGFQYSSTAANLEKEAIRMMEIVARSPMQKHRPGQDMGEDVRLPYFMVKVDENGEITETAGEVFDLSDEDLMRELVELANGSGERTGILKSHNLRFLISETPVGKDYIFMDSTNEHSTLRSLLNSSLIVGVVVLIGFVGISTLLAYWAVKPVEKAWQQQKQFVADASHELKTPLTVILTNAELLNAQGCTDDERRSLSGNIITMSEQMRGLVESLLELARIDNGNKKAAKLRVSLSETVSQAAMLFEPVFFEKDMLFSYEVEDQVEMLGNDVQMKQLCDILLDNASKYACIGGEVVLTLKRNQKKHCILEVKNQGEAIAEDDLKNLFKRFYRADKARAMNHSYGLGLSIAQSICLDHGGKITAKSENGWNRFIVELPVKS